jgi:hypothetical protein
MRGELIHPALLVGLLHEVVLRVVPLLLSQDLFFFPT